MDMNVGIFSLEWLVEQVPVIAVMGTWLWTMYLDRKDAKKERVEAKADLEMKNKQLYELAEKVIEVASMWTAKSDLNTKEHSEILKKLELIKEDVTKIKMKQDV